MFDRQAIQPMSAAPKNGELIGLIIQFDSIGRNPTSLATDGGDRCVTVGFNTYELNGDDHWSFAGWHWGMQMWVEGRGEVVGWFKLPNVAVQADIRRAA